MRSCAFIGYQSEDFFFKHNELHPLCQKIKNALAEQTGNMYSLGVRRFYVGGTMGADMWAGEAVAALKEEQGYPDIELICLIPFEGHDSNWDDEYLERLLKLLSACDEKQVASTSKGAGAYKKRYRDMIDYADAVIAVCRGNNKPRTDADYALEYAKKLNKYIVTIHPETAVMMQINGK